jgi:hypothetical protein
MSNAAANIAIPKRNTRLIDITGKRFGRWQVLAVHPERRRYGTACKAVSVLWLCRCDCGTERVVFSCNLRRGLSTSCGCRKREKTRERSTKHGQARRGKVTRAYIRWLSMLQRCFNPNNKCYCYYGARDVTVCIRWLTFENFYADVGDPPPGLSLDRINVNGDYEPGNCRWATPTEQARNQRPKRRRSTLAEIQTYSASLTHAREGAGR